MNAMLTVLLKDLRLEGRSKDILSTTLFFAGLVVLIMGFAFGPDTGQMRDAAPGVLWCALAFASVLAAGRAWSGEQESGALESLLLYPAAHEWLYLGKAAANALLMLVLGVVTAALTSIFFDVQFASLGLMALTLTLGVLGLSLVSTFYAAITVNLRAREALLPVLSFPIIIPVMIGAVKSTVLLSGAMNLDDYWAWTRLLLGFDVVTLLVATFIFPYAVES